MRCLVSPLRNRAPENARCAAGTLLQVLHVATLVILALVAALAAVTTALAKPPARYKVTKIQGIAFVNGITPSGIVHGISPSFNPTNGLVWTTDLGLVDFGTGNRDYVVAPNEFFYVGSLAWSRATGLVDLSSFGFPTLIATNAGTLISGNSPGLWDPLHGFRPSPTGFFPSLLSDNGIVIGAKIVPPFNPSFNVYHAFRWLPSDGSLLDLGTLSPGQNDRGSLAQAVSANGQYVTGYSFAQNAAVPDYHAFLWDQAHGMRDLGTLPGRSESEAFKVNDKGEVLGFSSLIADNFNHVKTFFWSAATGMVDLAFPGDTDSGAVVGVGGEFITDSGLVVFNSGTQTPSNGTTISNFVAGVWTATGGRQTLSFGPGLQSDAYLMSRNGVVAGFGNTSDGRQPAFAWTQKTGMVDLTVPGDTYNSIAYGATDNGLVYGLSQFPNGVAVSTHAFAWTPTTGLVNLTLPGDSSSTIESSAIYVNGGGPASPNGLLVGSSTGTNGGRGTFYFGNKLYDLNSHLDPVNAGWSIYEGDYVNDAGQIVAHGNDGKGYDGYVFLDPEKFTMSAVAATNVTSSSATIQWTTSYPTSGSVSTASNGLSSKTVTGPDSATHAITLTGLNPSTAYSYTVTSAAGNQTQSAKGSFVTAPLGSANLSVTGANVFSVGNGLGVFVTLRNSGNLAASNVQITQASLLFGGTTNTLPVAVGGIVPNGTGGANLTFPLQPSGPSVLRVSGTYNGGSFSGSVRVTVH